MKKSIKYYVILASFLAVSVLMIAFWGVGVNQQSNKYNHGIHSTDNGHWVLTWVDHRGTFTYTCDHCHEQLNTWVRF